MQNRPAILWSLAAATLVIIPLAALNLAVYEKAPLLRAATKPENLRILLFVSVLAFLNAWLLLKARWFSFWMSGILAGIMLYGNLYLMLATKNYGLAFFALGLLILTVFYSINLYQTLSMVYFRSGRRWFEKYPRFIPNVRVQLIGENQDALARMSSLGSEGCFLYTDNKTINPRLVNLELEGITHRSITCEVRVVAKTNDKTGIGLSFTIKDNDQWKDLHDFIDRIRSYGYV